MSHDATNWAIKQRGFKPATKFVLWHLCDRYHPDHGCFPSQETLAEDCEMSRSALNEHLTALEDAGLIAREQRREKGSKQQLSTRYRFAFEPGFSPVCRQKPCPESGHGSEGEAVSGNEGEPCPENGQSRVRNPDSNPVREPVIEPVNLREGASEREGGSATEAAEPAESPKAIERAFKLWYPTWDGYDQDSEPNARRAWFALTAEERRQAADRSAEYQQRWKAGGKSYKLASSTYLSEKRWEKLPPKPVEPAKPEIARPMGKAWMAIRLSEFLKPMVPENTWHPAPPMIAKMIAEGGEAGQREMMIRRERYGWPEVYKLTVKLDENRPVHASPQMVALGADFVSVELSGPVGQAWRRLHERMRLPWLPGEPRYAYFPPIDANAGDLDRAVAAAFWGLKERIEGDVHAA